MQQRTVRNVRDARFCAALRIRSVVKETGDFGIAR